MQSMKPLQWSHALTRVETVASANQGTQLLKASMEPRTHARGNSRRTVLRGRPLVSFNGATHSRAWKRSSIRSSSGSRGTLQWSHALTRVETRRWRASAWTAGSCFNGATHSRAWKRDQTIIYGIRVSASMEPRTHARGNLRKRPGGGPGKRASMEPRTHARGNKAKSERCEVEEQASMEPRTHARGNRKHVGGRTRGERASMEPRTHARGNRSAERRRYPAR